jgi:hypothetical protein
MFQELTDELLELTMTEKGYRAAMYGSMDDGGGSSGGSCTCSSSLTTCCLSWNC